LIAASLERSSAALAAPSLWRGSCRTRSLRFGLRPKSESPHVATRVQRRLCLPVFVFQCRMRVSRRGLCASAFGRRANPFMRFLGFSNGFDFRNCFRLPGGARSMLRRRTPQCSAANAMIRGRSRRSAYFLSHLPKKFLTIRCFATTLST